MPETATEGGSLLDCDAGREGGREFRTLDAGTDAGLGATQGKISERNDSMPIPVLTVVSG